MIYRGTLAAVLMVVMMGLTVAAARYFFDEGSALYIAYGLIVVLAGCLTTTWAVTQILRSADRDYLNKLDNEGK